MRKIRDFGKQLTAGLLALLLAIQPALASISHSTNSINLDSLSNILERGLDSAISTGLSTAAYDTSFGTGFVQSFGSSLVSLATADFQSLVGDQELGEGSFGHAFLHGLVGCVSAEATGADCAAGAVGGIAQSVYAGYLESNNLSTENAIEMAALIGGGVGFLFSGGEAANVNAASGISSSGMENNYLSHKEWNEFLQSLENCNGDATCIEIANNLALLTSLTNTEAMLRCDGDLVCLQPHIDAMNQVTTDVDLHSIMEDAQENIAKQIWQIGKLDRRQLVNPTGNWGAGYPDFITESCGGVGSVTCFDSYYQSMKFGALTNGASQALIGSVLSAGVAIAPSAVLALRTCALTPGCLIGLGNEVAAGVLAEFSAGGMSVVFVGVSGGKLAVEVGGEVVALLDDAGRLLTRIDDGSDATRAIFQADDGTLQILDNIATNRTLPSNSPYSQADYDAYVQRKLDAGETPRSPDDYVATRQQFDKGSAAHQAGVDQELDLQRNTYGDDAFIVENRNVNSADGCITCKPDIMAYDPNTNTLHVTEVKTGDATLTSNQAQVYPEIADGSASMNASQLNQLGLPTQYAGQPLSDIPNLNIVVEEVRY